jgi:hypothetical protein
MPPKSSDRALTQPLTMAPNAGEYFTSTEAEVQLKDSTISRAQVG